jgi:hypothetical protein
VPRQFIGPTFDPDRYELIEREAVGRDGSERWLAARWVDGRHVSVVVVTPTDGSATPAAPPALLERFVGPLAHAWGDADTSTTTSYDVRSVAAGRARTIAPGDRVNRGLLTLVLSAFALLAAAFALVLSSAGDDAQATLPPTTRRSSTTLPAPATTLPPPATTRPPVTTAPARLAPAVDTPGDSTVADLRSISAWTDGATLYVEVHFEPSTFTTKAEVTLTIDVDQDPATGHPGIDSLCSFDATAVGTDTIVTAGGTPDPGNAVRIGRAVGPDCNNFHSFSGGTVSVLADGYLVEIPLHDLGDDDGIVTYKATSATELDQPFASTPIQDVLPDVGQPPAVSVSAG